jgi:hypothetical protein
VNRANLILPILDRIFRKRYYVIVPLLLVSAIGWTFLRPKSAEQFPPQGNIIANSTGVADLGSMPELCAPLSQPDGYILISGTLQLDEVGNEQGFLQTDNEEIGISFDLDVSARVGIALKDGTTAQIQNYQPTKTGKLDFVIFLKSDGKLLYYESGMKSEFELSPISPTCNAVRVGMGNESADFDGVISATFRSGTDLVDAEKLVSKYEKQFNDTPGFLYYWSKNALFVGFLMIFFGNPFKPQKQDEESQIELV